MSSATVPNMLSCSSREGGMKPTFGLTSSIKLSENAYDAPPQNVAQLARSPQFSYCWSAEEYKKYASRLTVNIDSPSISARSGALRATNVSLLIRILGTDEKI